MRNSAWIAAQPLPKQAIRAVMFETFCRDCQWFEAHGDGAGYEREYVPGEFWAEEDPMEEQYTGAERVRVWLIDLFQEPNGERGLIRMRKPLPSGVPVTSDAEDAVNWMAVARRAPPPESDTCRRCGVDDTMLLFVEGDVAKPWALSCRRCNRWALV